MTKLAGLSGKVGRERLSALQGVRISQSPPAWIMQFQMGFMGDDQTAMIKTDPLVNMGARRAAKSEKRT